MHEAVYVKRQLNHQCELAAQDDKVAFAQTCKGSTMVLYALQERGSRGTTHDSVLFHEPFAIQITDSLNSDLQESCVHTCTARESVKPLRPQTLTFILSKLATSFSQLLTCQ